MFDRLRCNSSKVWVDSEFSDIIDNGEMLKLNDLVDGAYSDKTALLDERDKAARKYNIMAVGSALASVALFTTLDKIPNSEPGLQIITTMASATCVLASIGCLCGASYTAQQKPEGLDFDETEDEDRQEED